MKIVRSILLVFTIGIISSLALIYFYLIQRDFTKNHREFLILLNNMQRDQSQLNYLILENSIYIYQNQDKIKDKIDELLSECNSLSQSTLLKDTTYKQIDLDFISLKKKVDINLENIENYLMFNAGIKNSLLFLTRHIENSEFLDIKDNHLIIKANHILKHFYNAKKIQDLDYLDKKEFLLKSDSKDKKIQKFIKKFNLHSNFLMNNYPSYLNSVDAILHNNIYDSMIEMNSQFSQLALKDFKALDRFAIILFIIFVLSFSMMIFLLYSYMKKNHKLQVTTESLKHSLTYDQLTDLYNRKALEHKLNHISKPTILLINIDGFKNINDIYGNKIGDSLLIKISKLLVLKFSTYNNADIFRLGGDEFGIVFDNIAKENVCDIARNLEIEISKHKFNFNELKLYISVSIVTNNIFPIMENADLTLKLLKQNPTKRVMRYTDELNLKKSVEENMKIVEIIKDAISNDRIIPYFQPIVNLQTLKIEKYEALVRLKLKDGTILSPFKFLEISKKSSHYYEITRIMIEKVIEIAIKYPQYRFSINLSMLDILNEKLISILFRCFNKNLSVVSRIDIELLESEFLEDTDKVQEFIERIHSYGSKILIDDFGSGYSNFSYFSELDIDIVKIDGSIVSEITDNTRKLHILKTIYQFTTEMEMVNIAEYVENREIAIILKDIGVKYAQGYYFSQPLPKPLESDEVTL